MLQFAIENIEFNLKRSTIGFDGQLIFYLQKNRNKLFSNNRSKEMSEKLHLEVSLEAVKFLTLRISG